MKVLYFSTDHESCDSQYFNGALNSPLLITNMERDMRLESMSLESKVRMRSKWLIMGIGGWYCGKVGGNSIRQFYNWE